MSNNAKDSMCTGSNSAKKIFLPANNVILDMYFYFFKKAINTSSMMQYMWLKVDFSNG